MEWTGLANISKISREGLHRALAESAAGIDAHEQEAIAFFKMFPDQHVINNPYKIMLAQREWTCTVADFTGTMKGPMTMPYGAVIPPTNKSFHVDFCTVARWNEQGQIVEENLFYDLMGMLKQIGIMPGQAHVTTSDSIMAERMPALFIGHGNPMNALLVKPLYTAVDRHRCDAAEAEGDTFSLGTLVHRRRSRHREHRAEDDPRLRRVSVRAVSGAVSRAR